MKQGGWGGRTMGEVLKVVHGCGRKNGFDGKRIEWTSIEERDDKSSDRLYPKTGASWFQGHEQEE